jgi:hypothetical protein
MRGWDICLLVICISSMVGVVNGLVYTGVLTLGGEITAVQTPYTSYTVEEIETTFDGDTYSSTQTIDYLEAGYNFIAGAALFGIHLICATTCIIPYLVVIFGLDINPLIPGILQSVLYFIYASSYWQMKTRSSIGMMQ